MYRLIKDLTNLNRVFCSSDYDKTIKYLKKILRFKVKIFANKSQVNGWVIPPKWDVKEAKIFKQGKLLYDASKNPLSLISLSKKFSGKVDLKTLKKHLYYDHRFNNAIPFHFRQMYKSWNRDWGFCVTKKFYDSLSPGNYNIEIKTQESKGKLKVLEYNLPGKYPHTFVFVAHLDHPGMSNDNLSGCAVGIELFKFLSKKKLKFSYSLILTQEIIGSEYYLNSLKNKYKRNLLEALYLDTLGTKTKISIQSSINQNTNMEYALEKILKKMNINFNKASYRSLARNDENSWSAHKIPMSTLTRFPYPQYHSSKDNISIISKKSLLVCYSALKQTINFIEKTKFIEKRFQGIVCLSNPKYNLYTNDGEPAFGKKISLKSKKIRKIIDLIPLLEKPTSIDYISSIIDLDKKTILQYLKKWKEKKLIAIL